jgi:hypothetical protein
MEAKPDQHTTPVDAASAGDELVTIVDPRHALFGQTLLLLEVANKPYWGQCCVVQWREGFLRHVPLAATSRSAEPPVVFPVPLGLTALQQLLTVYQRLASPIGKVLPDGSPSCFPHERSSAGDSAPSDCGGTSLAGVEPHPTTDSVCHARARLPGPASARAPHSRPERGTES